MTRQPTFSNRHSMHGRPPENHSGGRFQDLGTSVRAPLADRAAGTGPEPDDLDAAIRPYRPSGKPSVIGDLSTSSSTLREGITTPKKGRPAPPPART
jgi:hypothetical protein